MMNDNDITTSFALNASPTDSTTLQYFTENNAWAKYICIITQEISTAVNVIAICVGLLIILGEIHTKLTKLSLAYKNVAPKMTHICFFFHLFQDTISGVNGNSLVLLVLFKYPNKRFTPFNWLLCHLAVADLAIGVTLFWWFGLGEILGVPVSSFQKVIFYGISIVAVIASIEGLLVIALDRYLLILQQAKYMEFLTRQRLGFLIVMMWLIPFFLELFAPMFGWSCVERCDCRIHNIAPDDVYCFGKECSQILPPLTKHQMFISSVVSVMILFATLALYIRIFVSVWKKSKKLKEVKSSHRTPSHSKSDFTSLELQQSNSVKKGRPNNLNTINISMFSIRGKWRHEHLTGKVQVNPEATVKKRPYFTHETFQVPNQELLKNDRKLNCEEALTDKAKVNKNRATKFCCMNSFRHETLQRKISRQDFASQGSGASVSTITTVLSACDTSPIVDDVFSNDDKKKIEEDLIFHRTHQVITMARQPKVLQTCQSRVSSSNLTSVSRTALKRGNQLKRKTRRSKTSLKKDMVVMRSMCVILAVFVITTAPLMIFLIYTFFNNDRNLKEIFNLLLQLTTVNSLLNPILYFWRLPKMNEKMLKLVHVQCWRNKWKIKLTSCRSKTLQISSVSVAEPSKPSRESHASNYEEKAL